MSTPLSIQRSINHWVHALSLFGTRINEISVSSGSCLELTDDFFDGVDTLPIETEWFQVDGARNEIFLDDDVSTVRLANRHVLRDLHGDESHSLVSWFGYQAENYELIRHAHHELSESLQVDPNDVAWIGWDYRKWRTYFFDGARLVPITETGAETAGLDVDVNRITWMGWDGENLDIFTSEFPQVPENLSALFIGNDDSVLAVHQR
jgi:hypothetical protein